MKRGSATKKSGTIAYQLHVRNDLQGKATKTKTKQKCRHQRANTLRIISWWRHFGR